jgi:hypothetical protein
MYLAGLALLLAVSPAFAQSVALSPALLSFTGTAGGANPAAQTMSVFSSGGGSIGDWTISVSTDDGSSWLSVSPASGSGAAPVSVSVNAAALAGGAHNGIITITTAGGASSTARVYAQMCSSQVIVSPPALVFTSGVGPGVLNVLSVTALGCPNSPPPFPATISVSTKDGGNWLSASPGPGPVGGLTFVSANPNGLAAGIYNGAVTLTFANGATTSTPVTLILAKPAFALLPQAFTFLSRPGGPNPPAQLMSVSFPAAGTQPSWTVSTATSDGGNWLSTFPGSGLGQGGLELFVNKEGLSPGIYYGTVTINAGAAGTTQAPVSFEVLSNTSAAYTDSYYFPHLVIGGGWQTTITYVNYSPRRVYCQINFHSDLGDALRVPITPTFAVPSLPTVIEPGGSFHIETQADPNSALLEGWADAQCTGPVKASLLFRLYNGGAAVSEASVGAATPAWVFSTFAQIGPRGSTGIALANISTTTQATLTLTAYDSAGQALATRNLSLGPRSHSAVTADQLFIGLAGFTGSVRITSSSPIIALTLNLEANPVFSSLPPAELSGGPVSRVAYYFPHLVFGGGWQTTLTYVNDSLMNTCQTTFVSDSGSPLSVSFSDQSGTTRTDVINPNGAVHEETQAALDAPIVEGWAEAMCMFPVKASLLFRFYNSQGAVSEASVNATTAPASEFATFAKTGGKGNTGIAFANPSILPATISIIGLSGAGIPSSQAPASLVLPPMSHFAVTVDKLAGLAPLFAGGSVQIVSTVPIVVLSLNFEDAPSFSSLPPAELQPATPMATATGP